jgi:hypothetical protein|tara:strand:+ start:4141 stop:4392 length:252 start_codon:yes stop_codon:yes gene_type:complete
MKARIKKILREFNMEILDSEPYKDGELVLEYVDIYDYPRYVIFHETGDTEEGNTDGEIVVELDSRFVDAEMAKVIMQYIAGRK